MLKLLESLASSSSTWIELRYHARHSKRLVVRNGRVEETSSSEQTGVGIRAFVDGAFGFASTSDLTRSGISRAADVARSAARAFAVAKRQRIERLARATLARGNFPLETEDPLQDHTLDEKLALIVRLERQVSNGHELVVSSAVSYEEMIDEKAIATSDGAAFTLHSTRPGLRILAVAGKEGKQAYFLETIGVTGGWSDLFRARQPEEQVRRAVRLAVDQLEASAPTGGVAQVILDPDLVSVLAHEAIGHNVEADIVLGGAATADKLNQRVASEKVTLRDSGMSVLKPNAVGLMPVDDEGIPNEGTTIIENGILRSYLHNRETAGHFDVAPTGNARANTYQDEPLVRMTNTYIEPGVTPLEEMVASMADGYLLRGFSQTGQADSNGEFMFGVKEAWRVQDGHQTELVRGVTISGNAFETLLSVDAVGDSFDWEYPAGYCGKGQAAKVDGGGPFIRCRLTIGGSQEGANG